VDLILSLSKDEIHTRRRDQRGAGVTGVREDRRPQAMAMTRSGSGRLMPHIFSRL
jgi:homoserine kinase